MSFSRKKKKKNTLQPGDRTSVIGIIVQLLVFVLSNSSNNSKISPAMRKEFFPTRFNIHVNNAVVLFWKLQFKKIHLDAIMIPKACRNELITYILVKKDI